MIEDRKKAEAINIVEKLNNNQHVNRWDILKRRALVLDIIRKETKYNHLEDEVYLLIDMAKESL